MSIRTVAVFHAGASVVSAWNCAEGIVETLQGMGFETIDCGNPQFRVVDIEVLKTADLIILSALEWYEPLIKQVYGSRWLELRAPKVAWYAESFHRDDRDFHYSRTAILADLHYFPALQDAIEFGGRWLPFGVDLNVFRPRPTAKQFDTAFVGQVYEKRRQYVEAAGLSITHVTAANDPAPKRSAELLSEAYSAISIFLNLPAYSRLLVTKVTEVMACKTMLITPVIDHPTALRNMDIFANGRHLVYYRQERPDELRDIVNYYVAHPDERDEIAEEGWRETVKNHGLASKIHTILDDLRSLRGSRPRGEAPEAGGGTPAAAPDGVEAGLYFLMSCHLSLLYFDPDLGAIRQADPVTCPMNLVVEVTDDGAARLVRIEGALLERQAVDVAGALRLEQQPNGDVALMAGDGYASADTGDVVRFDCAELRESERFQLHPARLARL